MERGAVSLQSWHVLRCKQRTIKHSRLTNICWRRDDFYRKTWLPYCLWLLDSFWQGPDVITQLRTSVSEISTSTIPASVSISSRASTIVAPWLPAIKLTPWLTQGVLIESVICKKRGKKKRKICSREWSYKQQLSSINKPVFRSKFYSPTKVYIF